MPMPAWACWVWAALRVYVRSSGSIVKTAWSRGFGSNGEVAVSITKLSVCSPLVDQVNVSWPGPGPGTALTGPVGAEGSRIRVLAVRTAGPCGELAVRGRGGDADEVLRAVLEAGEPVGLAAARRL